MTKRGDSLSYSIGTKGNVFHRFDLGIPRVILVFSYEANVSL